MEDKLSNFLSSCSAIDFGDIDLSDPEKEFCRQLSRQVLSLCKSLPPSVQTDAVFFLMRYGRMSLAEELNFFKTTTTLPAWSIIYWLAHLHDDYRGLSRECVRDALTAHAMAMLLHSLDDHLNDGEMKVTHLNLLLRSQAWLTMNAGFNRLAGAVSSGKRTRSASIWTIITPVCAALESLNRWMSTAPCSGNKWQPG